MDFSEKIKAARKKCGISQEGLAELLGVSRQAVSKWELGDGYPQTEKLAELARTLNVSLDYLLLGEEAADGQLANNEEIIVKHGQKIFVKTYDGETVVQCYKFKIGIAILTPKNGPKFVLWGIEKATFWGENKTILGWYRTREDAQREIEAITAAIGNAQSAYELKYAAEVKMTPWGVKFKA